MKTDVDLSRLLESPTETTYTYSMYPREISYINYDDNKFNCKKHRETCNKKRKLRKKKRK